MKDSVLILSGGMDSTTLLHAEQDRIALCVTFNYGSNHANQEIMKAIKTCANLDIRHEIIDLRGAFKGFESGLLSGAEEIPEGHYAAANMKATVVPFRNGIMLSIAAGLAESNNLRFVLIASHAGDHDVYPDCRPEFNLAMDKAIEAGTDYKVSLGAPFKSISKRKIAEIGDDLGLSWDSTYSCYKGGDKHCGRCSTCVERLEALDGLDDNTEYLDTEYWKTVCQT